MDPRLTPRAARVLIAWLAGTLVVPCVSALDLEPKVVSSNSLPDGLCVDVAISANHAYVVVQDFGLHIVDVSDSANPRKVGQYRPVGYPSDVTVSGGYGYLATRGRALLGTNSVGGGLDIIDVSDPANPQRVGSYSGPDASAVAVSGSHAYLVAQDSIRLVDVSDPADPQTAGSILINSSAVAISGHHAYVAQYNQGMFAFDVSDPANPELVGSYMTNGYFPDLVVLGNYAYLADTTAGVHIVDITEPAAPELKSKYDVSAYKLAVSGSYLYVVEQAWGQPNSLPGLHIVRVGDAAIPVLVSRYEANLLNVAVSSDRAYVLDGNAVTTLDVNDPTTPTLVGAYVVRTDARDVALSGAYAYVADGVAGLEVFDVSNPARPTRVGGLFMGEFAKSVSLAGNHALLTAGSALHIINVNNPTNPARVAQYDTRGDARNVTVAGNLAYVACSAGTNPAGGGLHIIDISNPVNPQRVGRYSNTNALDVAIAGDYAYLTVAPGAFPEAGALEAIDISNPANPSRVSRYMMADYTQGIAVVADYAYVADGRAGLQIINISNPARPEHVARFAPTSHRFAGIALDWIESAFTGVEVVGNHCYVAELFLRAGHGTRIMGSSVQIIDVGTPSNPERVGSTPIGTYDVLRPYELGSHAQGMVLSGKHLLVAGGQANLQAVDFSLPAAAQVIGDLPPGGYAPQVTLADNYAYIAEQRRWTGSNNLPGGFRIIDVSDSANPILIGRDDVGEATDVGVSGTNACVLADGAVHIFDVTNPANPRRAGAYNSGADLARVAVVGNYAYVVAKPYSGRGGLHVINFTNPASPQRVGGYDPGGEAFDVAVAGNYAFIAQGARQTSTNLIHGGLQVIAISDPTKPQRAGAYDVEGSAYAVAISGSYAYLVGGGMGLHIVDITNPANPRRVGADETIDPAEAVAVSGNYAYVTDWEARLHVLDISDPATPRRIGANTSLTGFYHESPSSVLVAGNKLYAGVAAKGLFILHTYRPIRFQQVSRADTGIRLQITGPPGVPGRLQRSGNLLNWNDWMSVSFGEEPVDVMDDDSAGARFYRLALP